MAAEPHEQTLRDKKRDWLSRMGIHREDDIDELPDDGLREPPVQIHAPTRVRDMTVWRTSMPQRVDLSGTGVVFLAVGLLVTLLFWPLSTFPVAVKLAGIGLTIVAAGVVLLLVSYILWRRS